MYLLAKRSGTLIPPSSASPGRPHQRTCCLTRNSSLVVTSQVRAPAAVDYVVDSATDPQFLDHMLSLEWTATQGWLPARITPYQNLSLDPATCVFHYAFECFEGMKAYKDKSGNIRLFRPDKNMARLNKSSARIALPTFDPDALTELIGKFVKEDERFVPE